MHGLDSAFQQGDSFFGLPVSDLAFTSHDFAAARIVRTFADDPVNLLPQAASSQPHEGRCIRTKRVVVDRSKVFLCRWQIPFHEFDESQHGGPELRISSARPPFGFSELAERQRVEDVGGRWIFSALCFLELLMSQCYIPLRTNC